MQFKEIYRVEHVKTNEGVYTARQNPGIVREVLFEYYQGEGHCPPPWSDIMLSDHWRSIEDTSLWKFGFADLTQFNRWFDSEEHRGLFRDAGFVLKVYSVPIIMDSLIFGAAQCIFFEDHARFVRALDLVTNEEVELISDIKIKEKELCDEIAY